MDKKSNRIELIKNAMKNNLRVRVRRQDAWYVIVELLYKGEVIDSDWAVEPDWNSIDKPIGTNVER